MMKAHGDYIMPKNVPAFEFLNLENDKISTSRNWAVWAHEYVEEFQDNRMYCVMLYFLLHQKPRITTLHGKTSRQRTTRN